MQTLTQSLSSGYNTPLSLLTLNTAGPLTFWFDKATTGGMFTFYGTLDSAAVSGSPNLTYLDQITVTPGATLPAKLAQALQVWPYVVVNAPGSATLYVTGNLAGGGASSVASTATPASIGTFLNSGAPPGAGAWWSALINCSAFSVTEIRVAGSAAMTVNDTFVVFGFQDSTANPVANGANGGVLLGSFTGGGGAPNQSSGSSLIVGSWPYIAVCRTGGATTGTILAASTLSAGVTPSGTAWITTGNSPGGASILGTLDNSAIKLSYGTGGLGIGVAAPGSSGLAIDTPAAGTLSLALVNATTLTLGGASSALTLLSINVASGSINVANASNACTVNVGTGAAVISTNIGSQTGASATVINGGSGVSAFNVQAGGTLTLCGAVAACTLNVGTGAAVIATTLGSLNTTSTTVVQAGASGSLSIKNRGVTWTWPTADGTSGQALTTNGTGTLAFSTIPASVANAGSFQAATSLTTAVAQNIPISALLATSTDLTLGQTMAQVGSFTTIRIKFTGSVANVGGQTITAGIFKNGASVAASSVSGIATTAGTQTGTATFAAQAWVAGDVMSAQILPSGVLTAALTDVMISFA